jgi:hypothetical protein
LREELLRKSAAVEEPAPFLPVGQSGRRRLLGDGARDDEVEAGERRRVRVAYTLS